RRRHTRSTRDWSSDVCSSDLFLRSEIARQNLANEGIAEGVHVVGNSVIDALMQNLETARTHSRILKRLRLEVGRYAVLTFHRARSEERRVGKGCRCRRWARQ